MVLLTHRQFQRLPKLILKHIGNGSGADRHADRKTDLGNLIGRTDEGRYRLPTFRPSSKVEVDTLKMSKLPLLDQGRTSVA